MSSEKQQKSRQPGHGIPSPTRDGGIGIDRSIPGDIGKRRDGQIRDTPVIDPIFKKPTTPPNPNKK